MDTQIQDRPNGPFLPKALVTTRRPKRHRFRFRLGTLIVAFAYWLGGIGAEGGRGVRIGVGAENESQYIVQALENLDVLGEDLPDGVGKGKYEGHRWNIGLSQVKLDAVGEAYLMSAQLERPPGRNEGTGNDGRIDKAHLAIRAPQGNDVYGTLYLVAIERDKIVSVRFRIAQQAGSVQLRNSFYRTKRDYYESLLARDVAGAAWFRHQARDAALANGIDLAQDDIRSRRFFGRPRANDLENTFALVSGGRAVSENLQLDRILPPDSSQQVAQIPIDQLVGITVKEFDWAPHIKDIEQPEDSLARFIPADQHALFFPSFAAVLDMIDHADTQGTPLLRVAETRSEDARTRDRYQRQMCLPLGRLERLFGGELIAEVAVTGSDPYYRTGTDVAVLFQSDDPEALKGLLAARMAIVKNSSDGVADMQGEVRGVKYQGVRSPDRQICAYLSTFANVVLVTNSPAQLERILRVFQGDQPSLATLGEYKFFRNRYPLTNAQEKACLIISDATIRRWCGPRWRIATSRRTRAAGIMSEIQAQQLDALVANRIATKSISAGWQLPGAEAFTITERGVNSETYGSLDFQTPISEMTITHVTPEERRLYETWRDGYQRYWSNFFDPIAVSFSASKDGVGMDLTVMPLIEFSDYRMLANVSQGGAIDASRIDMHSGTLLHAGLALNRESPTLKQYAAFADGILAQQIATQLDVGVLSWLGEGIALYLDDDPFWKEVSESENPRDYLRNNVHRMPVAVHFDVHNGLKLTAFLVGLRGYVEQTGPGMTVWESRTHRDRGYVKIAASPQSRTGRNELDNLAVYYAASGKSLVISLSEEVVKRSIDRQLDGSGVIDGGDVERKPAVVPARDPEFQVVGSNVNVVIDARAMHFIAESFGRDYQRVMQDRAWSNLPILNEWHRRYPDQDPLALHEKYWNTRLVCPGGGTYRWNDTWQTMESTVYGHPGVPLDGPLMPVSLQQFVRAAFGLTLETHGLRSHVELMKAEPAVIK